MKKNLSFLLISALLLGCKEEKSASTPTKKAEPVQTTTIGTTLSNTTNPFFKSAFDSYQKWAQQWHTTLIINQAENSQETQNQQFDTMMQQGAKALVVNIAETKMSKEVINKLCLAKMPTVYFNRKPPEMELKNCKYAYFVDGDAMMAGRFQGEDAVEQWHKNPQWDKNQDGVLQYAMLMGFPNHEGTALRTEWVIATIQYHPTQKVPTEKVFQEYANFNRQKAQELVRAWSDTPDFSKVEVIFANNDVMALGALDVLKEKQLSVPVFGIDAIQEALQAYEKGELAGTVFNDYDNQAKISLQMALNLATGQPLEKGVNLEIKDKVVKIAYQKITKENFRSFMK